MKHACAVALIGIGHVAPSAWGLTLTHVQHHPPVFDPAQGEKLRIQYRLSEAATVILDIYDGRDLMIRRISSGQTLPRGDQMIMWDGLDERQRRVPPEAYHYTLTARGSGGESVRYDVSDVTGSEELTTREVVWNSGKQNIGYVLPKPARVNIRIGLKNNGPLLRTLIDWVPRPAGLQEETWDGWDAARVLDLSRHPQLDVVVQAFALSDNTVIVGPRASQVQLISDMPWKAAQRQAKKVPRKRMYAHSQQPTELRRDFTISLALPDSQPRNEDDLPVITGKTPIRLDAQPTDRERLLAERFEPVFFVDGQFAFETEVGFLPMTWVWDPQGSNEGVHYVTANVRGYEGHFGTTTVRVYVKTNSQSKR